MPQRRYLLIRKEGNGRKRTIYESCDLEEIAVFAAEKSSGDLGRSVGVDNRGWFSDGF